MKTTLNPPLDSDKLIFDAVKMRWQEKVLIWSLVIIALGALAAATICTLQEGAHEYRLSERV
ncbi:hypothetical protein OEG84_11580 [Hoeflea sp. G2-23]|uniref:Polysaccharide chain length determinant N-terminal domain-containing protein n=1 Tax=Hoeflea algicola TaxID=2983763 RepID=A0ABT3Z9D2_9HYPH|nr:hypothetical protein [Hoeflea algicola]MCY0148334.1 hypothetical protein [Hoeflea algicola]